MAEPYSPHTEAHPDVAGWLLDALTPDEAAGFADHLVGCDACAAELNAMAELPGLLADLPALQPLPTGLEERTFAAVERAARSTGRRGWAPPGSAERTRDAASAVEPIGTVTAIDDARDTGTPQLPARGRRRTPRLLIAAAAVILVAGAVEIRFGLRQVTPAPVTTMDLTAADAGPAHARAILRTSPAGLSIEMTAEGLAVSPPGTFYTCWLVGPGDSLAHPNRVSVGSFVVHGGATHVQWTTGADFHRFPKLGVTLEPDNGNPSHQGPPVLRAD